MLYDNGPLLALCCDAWQITGEHVFREAAAATRGWARTRPCSNTSSRGCWPPRARLRCRARTFSACLPSRRSIDNAAPVSLIWAAAGDDVGTIAAAPH